MERGVRKCGCGDVRCGCEEGCEEVWLWRRVCEEVWLWGCQVWL